MMLLAYEIPSSTSSDWRRALDVTAPLAGKCEPGHPLLSWRATAEKLLACTAGAPSLEALAEDLVIPASYLCRLSRSLADAPAIGGRVRSEIKSAMDADGFFHLEYLLFLAARITASGAPVEVIGQIDAKAPDLALPEGRVVLECTARGRKLARASLYDDFEHARQKFHVHLARADRSGWRGVLAVDLGIVGSPSLSNIGRSGWDLSQLTDEIDSGLAANPIVSAVLITWASVEVTPAGIGAVGCTGWRGRSADETLPGVTDVFRPWDARRRDVAVRTERDRPDPRRAR
jgi:hypothetical protein